MEKPLKARFVSLISNTQFWVLSLLGMSGLIFGLGTFTFSYARGTSYLSNDPDACANCHIMRDRYDGWLRSSHREVAVCNDCHTPHDFFGKWFTKGLNGFNHSRAFTMGDFHEPIQITGRNAAIAQENCLRCHEALVSQIAHSPEGEEMQCVSCHGSVGHDEFPRASAGH
jgi:cytochrome c nitrite reductase small subunit